MQTTMMTVLATALMTAVTTFPVSADVAATGPSPTGHLSLHGGIGFDALSAGAAFNAGLGYRAPVNEKSWYEGAVDIYHHSSESDWEEGFFTGTETVKFTVVATRFNMLFNYANSNVHPIVGFGLFAAGLEWAETERRIGDTQLTSTDDFEGTVFGNIFNVGLGLTVGQRTELRFEAPIMIFWGAEGNSVGLPITLSGGVRF